MLLVIYRQHVGAVTGQAVTRFAGKRMFIVAITLGERSVEKTGERNIESVQPDHRRIAVIAMIMPGPGWRDNKIAKLHDRAFAIDAGMTARTIQHKTQRRLAMAMSGSHFVGHHQLQPGVQRIRDVRIAPHARVFQDQHPALGFLRANQIAGFEQPFPRLVEFPQVGQAVAFRLRGNNVSKNGPQRGVRKAIDFFIKRDPFGSFFRLFG